MLEKAIQIAVKAHAGQKDKAGQSYISHLLRVMLKGESETEKICGVLHDLVEDTDYSFDDLRKAGFSEDVIEVLRFVTKIPNEDYTHFIDRIKANPTAVKVKLNDLEDNMDIRRLRTITEKDRLRINKYIEAYNALKKCTL